MKRMVLGLAAIATVTVCSEVSTAQVPDTVQDIPQAEPGSDDYMPFYLVWTDMPNNIGTGPYPAEAVVDLTLPDHVVYRPKDIEAMGDKPLGVVVWGNGGCAMDAAQSRFHQIELASYGYLVIAPGKLLTGPDAPEGLTVEETFANPEFTRVADVTAGLDWILAEAERPGSQYFGRIDPDMVAVSGHSCGSGQAVLVAQDPRVDTLILLSGGAWDNVTDHAMGMENEPFFQEIIYGKEQLDKLHTPILDIVGGPSDIAWDTANNDFAYIDHVPIALVSAPLGHELNFMDMNGGRVAEISVAWLEWQLRGDERYAPMFVGDSCTLCTDPRWTIKRKMIP